MEYREYNGSKEHLLEVWSRNKRTLALREDFRWDVPVALVQVGRKLELYVVEGGDKIPIESYSWYADVIKRLTEVTRRGKVRAIGHAWLQRHDQTVKIANVSIGNLDDGKFLPDPFALAELGCTNVDTGFMQRQIQRVKYEYRGSTDTKCL